MISDNQVVPLLPSPARNTLRRKSRLKSMNTRRAASSTAVWHTSRKACRLVRIELGRGSSFEGASNGLLASDGIGLLIGGSAFFAEDGGASSQEWVMRRVVANK